MYVCARQQTQRQPVRDQTVEFNWNSIGIQNRGRTEAEQRRTDASKTQAKSNQKAIKKQATNKQKASKKQAQTINYNHH